VSTGEGVGRGSVVVIGEVVAGGGRERIEGEGNEGF
jgi:hypothetical protein